MKRVLLFIALIVGGYSITNAQVTGISVEPFYTADGSVANYPAGHTTWRIYANTTNATDRVTTVSGDSNNPLSLSVGGQGIWNFQVGGATGDAATCLIYTQQPLAEYDSYMTIGITCNGDGAANPVYKAEDSNQAWQNQAFATTPYGSASEFVVNTPIGGAWFVLTDNPGCIAGTSNKVLLGQITTDGDICGIFNLQVFPNYTGAGSEAISQTFEFSSNPGCTPGCTDNTALNFNESATYDNGLCLFQCDLDLTATLTASPLCYDSNEGAISVVATGAQSFYEFFVDGVSLGLSDDGTDSFVGLGNGVYNLVVRDTRFDNPLANPDGLACEADSSITINTPVITLSGSVGAAIECAGDNNGSVSTPAGNYGGGTGNLSFALYTAAGNAVVDGNNDPVVVNTPNYTGLTQGTYYFVATDNSGCSAQGNNFSITAPAAIFMEASATGVGACYNSTEVSKQITWFGGTGDVNFSLVNDGTYPIDGGTANFSVIVPVGENTIYAMDANGCTAEYTFTVAGAPAIIIDAQIDGPSCNGDTDGTVTVAVDGGTGAFTYSFNGGAYTAVNSIGDLGNATIVVSVRDANDCEASQTVEVVEPGVLGADVTTNNISCNGLIDGAINIEAVGGTFPFTYALNGTPTNADTSPSFTGLGSGSYTVNIIDANGCAYVAASAENITEPSAVEATATTSDVDCFGDNSGEIAVTATGGTGSYAYSVNGGALSTANPITGLGAGTFEVTVYDANQCSAIVGGLTISAPAAALSINGLSANPIDEDAGGSSPYSVSGGTAPYQYSWNGPGGFSFNGQDLTGLTTEAQAGDYVLTVTDDNGCTVSQTIMVTGVNELGRVYAISMYPNPNNGQFLMNIEGLAGETMAYTIIDNNGRVIMTKDMGNVSATRVESVDMMGAAAGVYQVRLQIGSDVHSIRFIVQ
ncbi:MAG: T9SS type A sorting domain-containing protein [Flavobacteriales bacterium]